MKKSKQSSNLVLFSKPRKQSLERRDSSMGRYAGTEIESTSVMRRLAQLPFEKTNRS
ncbi:hypothetical protein [Haladaptatus paucihalophilus]|uniref:hypothetical protein n=1 Tax=Haladaptatus paucihalophilus TaxID=367189 RepID=UPI000AAFF827|nr:hypothetical protein [Haladaptatus paucihalophilus]